VSIQNRNRSRTGARALFLSSLCERSVLWVEYHSKDLGSIKLRAILNQDDLTSPAIDSFMCLLNSAAIRRSLPFGYVFIVAMSS
jgi:hypothetical protein